MAADDLQARVDELQVLAAIYGDALEVAPDGSTVSVTLPDPRSQPQLVLRLLLPDAYPSSLPPVFELHSDVAPAAGDLGQWAADLEALFVPGEVVLFTWIELLRERWEDVACAHCQQQEAAAAAAAVEAAEAAAAADALDDALRQSTLQDGGSSAASGASAELQGAMEDLLPLIVHGEPFTEKRSTFQAHLAPASSILQVGGDAGGLPSLDGWPGRHDTAAPLCPRSRAAVTQGHLPRAQVEAFMDILLQNNKVRAATHNIMAYRIERPATTEGAAPAFLQACCRCLRPHHQSTAVRFNLDRSTKNLLPGFAGFQR